MKICVVGAGSIGGYLAVLLSNAGHDVTVIARGAHLKAIREQGLRLVLEEGGERVARVGATDSIAAAGCHDLVILGVKAHQVAPIADGLNQLFHADTVLVPMQNGIPWWYFQRHGGKFEGRNVETVDPGGHIAATIDPRRIVGCVVYPAAAIERPGVIRHIEGTRFPVGELDGASRERATMVSETFVGAGLKSPVLDNIRAEIWLKLWGNLSFNPISALTHSTLIDLCQFPLSRELAQNMMLEAQAVAGDLGIEFRVPIEKRIAGAEKVGKHKTSMLQDVEAGRDPEIDALVGSVIELGRLTGTPIPHICTVYALVKLLSKTMTDERVCVRATSPSWFEQMQRVIGEQPVFQELAKLQRA
ncbi:MAG TPA: 2-dehydropantoate 2-reductase [Burkholderiales bacterium]|jgi:2-dehydropantoate 2-reductase|nr:2-dehydropantoate 2-reductase [Burkholderiales bacterium]